MPTIAYYSRGLTKLLLAPTHCRKYE